MKKLLVWVTLLSSGCALFSVSRHAQEDKSIRFPNFHEHFATTVGGQEQLFELDGVTLKAITIAANDFVPPHAQQSPCEVRRESQRYRVIRQGDIIFVEVSADPSACGMKQLLLDWGAKYAIRADGQILRRLFDGEPEDTEPATRAAEGLDSGGTFVPDSQVGGVSGARAKALPPGWFDAGTPSPGSPSPPPAVRGTDTPGMSTPAMEANPPTRPSPNVTSDAG